MLVVGFVAGVIAVILLLWGLTRLVRRYVSRWHFIGFLVLACVSLVALYLGRPHYSIASVKTAAANSHAYVVHVNTVTREQKHLESYAADIIQSVRAAHPNASAVAVEFYIGSSSSWQARAIWAPNGDWQAGLRPNTQTLAPYRTVFDYQLP
ncbi:MAG: hypothetical protein K6T63_09185 [Alicyclobacillus herbarius]|uniref:hypothetical protein n=1 Tax=Alicyclobacillus herbarius TaxID=122960 RepID=UPI00235660A0|nr:hypothetical protein [Alicyclobacillus herbarius]MCL6632794.1 hypothetical protein [Alicyclobacillus herbarius]